MKRFLNILYFVSLSMFALGQSTQGDSFFFMDAGVNVVKETSPQAPKIDTVVVIQRDTLVQYEEYAGNESQAPMLIRYSAYERRMFGLKEYSYGETQMDKKAFQRFLYENDRNVFLQYRKNQDLIQAGWWLFGGGLSLVFVGGMCGIVEGFLPAIMCPVFFGGLVIPSGIMLYIGYKRKNDIVDSFNRNNSRPAITLGLTSSKNGIGLALNF